MAATSERRGAQTGTLRIARDHSYCDNFTTSPWPFSRTALWTCSRRTALLIQFGEAKVEQLHQSIRSDHDVLGFQVAMHDSRLMGVDEPFDGCTAMGSSSAGEIRPRSRCIARSVCPSTYS